MKHGIARYEAKLALLEGMAIGRQVLHLGAVGETGSSVRPYWTIRRGLTMLH
jgi:hypothetical protein